MYEYHYCSLQFTTVNSELSRHVNYGGACPGTVACLPISVAFKSAVSSWAHLSPAFLPLNRQNLRVFTSNRVKAVQEISELTKLCYFQPVVSRRFYERVKELGE